MTDVQQAVPVAHEYGPSRVGHGEAQCVHCLGTNRENAAIAPNECSVRRARLTPIEGVAASGEKRQCSVCCAIVAAYKGGMCCHCHELPWAIIAPTPPATSPAIPEGKSGDGVEYGEGVGAVRITPEINEGLHRALLASSTPVPDPTHTREGEGEALQRDEAKVSATGSVEGLSNDWWGVECSGCTLPRRDCECN